MSGKGAENASLLPENHFQQTEGAAHGKEGKGANLDDIREHASAPFSAPISAPVERNSSPHLEFGSRVQEQAGSELDAPGSRYAATGTDGPRVLPFALPSERKVLPSEQAKSLHLLPPGGQFSVLPSEQIESEKEQAEWLKNLLPKLNPGWWDVAANGKGFIMKQKWREHGEQKTQPYPRISREQFLTLKGMDYEQAKITIEDRIYGHIDDCRGSKDTAKRERAGSAAARLGIVH